MSTNLKAAKFSLRIDVPLSQWNLPDEYQQVIEGSVRAIDPISLYLPWPGNAIPPEGKEIYLNNMFGPLETVVVTKHEYDYSKKRGLLVTTCCKPASKDALDLTSLLHASLEDFLLDTDKHIRSVLGRAGLKAEPDFG